ncbi:MAG: hypothetical protein AAB460_02830 [Patescibacteria group bacterium]
MQTKVVTGVLIVLGLILIGFALLKSGGGMAAAPECDPFLSKGMLEEGLTLGTDFILANQRLEGNFEYEYDWISKTYTDDDSSVRQAGALWGLALIYEYTHEERLIAPLEKSFAFFEKYSKTRADDARYILYPGEEEGSLGTVALAALAHIEYLNARENELSETELARHKKLLDGYLRFLTSAVTEDTLFHASYDEDGLSYGDASSYYDGEALLALVKAARYRGYEEWENQIKELADVGYAENIKAALKENPDSDVTKGYYQWSSMAFHELSESGWKKTEKYGDYTITLADWMIDTHKVLERTRNTAYAFEGIVSAYAIAKKKGDEYHIQKFRCVIEAGIFNLMTWQVGASYQNQFIKTQFKSDAKAKGGIQNSAQEAPLRIDVTQHQVHAVTLALEHFDFGVE